MDYPWEGEGRGGEGRGGEGRGCREEGRETLEAKKNEGEVW